MTYITQTWSGTPAGDLTNAVGNELLATLLPDGSGGVNATAGAARVATAEADVDSVIGPDFVVPMTGSIPPIIVECAVDICVFYLYDRKPEFMIRGGDNPAQKRYDRAIKILKEIKSGARDLGRESPAPTKSAAVGAVIYHADTPFIVGSDADDTSTSTTGYNAGSGAIGGL